MRSHTTRVVQDELGSRLLRRKFGLWVIEGADQGASLISGDASATVGSAPANDLVCGDPAVSRHHLRVEVEGDGFVLSDLGSTNGTRIGSLQLREVVAHAAVDLQLGNTTVIRFAPLDDEQEIALPQTDRFGDVLGRSGPMLELFGKLERVAPTDATVLLEGETGTGKELIAAAIHEHSTRRSRPFVVVDCGAIPAGLLESELFGHVRGAFTSATNDRPGAFVEGDGGTVFLDEIGELESAMQPLLLRVLERGEVKPVGSERYRRVDVRIVAATNRDLKREINRGSFRSDLFYRLAVVQLRIPPLRQRPEDVELLVSALLPQLARQMGVAPPELSRETLQQMIAHPWPGNVRELRNFLERLVALAGHDIALWPEQSDNRATRTTGRDQLALEDLEQLPFKQAKTEWMAQFDIAYLSRLLERCNNNVAEAARRSGIDRVHLFRLIKKYKLRG